jgi:hypothetical protein
MGSSSNRIWTYPGASLDTPVCTVWRNGPMEHITSNNILQHLRSACSSHGSTHFGFEPHEVGTHSLRSGAAMKMYLGENAHWQMVERRFSLIHPKTGGAILAQRCKENANL